MEANRLECATFHILTPYPGTPLFRQMEREGRLLHRDWERYDTALVVFRPAQMTVEELQLGYDWFYRRLFSFKSIWARRPAQATAVPPYLAMAILDKRSNRLWHFLIKHRWIHTVWSPLVHLTRWRHLRFHKRLARQSAEGIGQFEMPVVPGVYTCLGDSRAPAKNAASLQPMDSLSAVELAHQGLVIRLASSLRGRLRRGDSCYEAV